MDKPISIPISADLGEAPASLTPAAPAQPVNPAAFFAALGSPIRWALVKLMADGRELSATEAAGALDRDFDGIRKHLQILNAAGVIGSRTGADRRVVVYFVPAVNRPEPGVLDYGFCRFFPNV